MVSAHTILKFGVAEGDGEWMLLAVTSRELLQVERTVKGFATAAFMQDVKLEGLYRIAHVVLRMRGAVPTGKTFDEFIDEWSVDMNDPTQKARRKALAGRLAAEGKTPGEIVAALVVSSDDDEAAAESESEADPIQPTV